MSITQTPAHPPIRTIVVRSITVALVANLAIWIAALLLTGDAPRAILPSDETATAVPVAAVVAASVIPTTIGAVFLTLASRRDLGLHAGIAIGFLTLASLVGPLTMDIPISSAIALSLMHLATGSAVVWAGLRYEE